MDAVPELRLTQASDAPEREQGAYVLYWMTAFRRLGANFALQHAARRAEALGKPLVIIETFGSPRQRATDRHARFVLQGMAEHARACRARPVAYVPFVERDEGEAREAAAVFAERACLVVCDDWPMENACDLGGDGPCRIERVDSCGLVPLLAPDKTFTKAFSFRAWLQKHAAEHAGAAPEADPLAALDLPQAEDLREVTERFPTVSEGLLAGEGLADLPLDHDVPPAPVEGGTKAARRCLARFMDERYDRYADEASDPDAEATSELSPYLHFGHLSVHEVFAAVAEREGWTPERMGGKGGSKPWWGMSAGGEAFLDELVTWREIGFNRCARTDDWETYASLPDWARETLEAHASDDRPETYDLDAFEAAATDDPLWNAAQTQLRRDGWLHNTVRMLWGKKILEWSESPERALEIMLHLNDRWGLDGSDPNSVSGIFWCLGRYDRAWGPERPIFGKVRYMSSTATRRKHRVKAYLERYAPGG